MLSKFLKFIIKYYLYSFLLLALLFLIRFINIDKDKNSVTDNTPIAVKDSLITDSRNGHTYRTRRFDKLWWMIDNINLDLEDSLYYKEVYIGKGSYCYNNNIKNAKKYGQLYDLSSAVEVCPTGWRLPTIKEWEVLNKKYANCVWDNNSSTGNYRERLPLFEPVGGGKGYLYRGFLPQEKNKAEDHLTYSGQNKFAYYWAQTERSKPYFFSINMQRCEAKRSLYQGASTRKTLAQGKFYSCRCVKEAN